MNNARMFFQTMITLASASLGLVAALAWNEAIKETIKQMLGTGESLAALYTYAILATVVAVVVLIMLARAAARVGGDAAIQREAEG
jgi:cytochrome b